jgi:hypothetical protein
VDLAALAEELQRDGAAAFAASWKDLLASIASKAASLGARAEAGHGAARG